jgi:hypothetical protein
MRSGVFGAAFRSLCTTGGIRVLASCGLRCFARRRFQCVSCFGALPRRIQRLASRARRRGRTLLVLERLRLLALLDALLTFDCTTLALSVVYQRLLTVQQPHRRAPFFAHAGQAGGHDEPLRALALPGACTRLHRRALALDASPLRRRIVERDGATAVQAQQQPEQGSFK